jgi:hypothetical protein
MNKGITFEVGGELLPVAFNANTLIEFEEVLTAEELQSLQQTTEAGASVAEKPQMKVSTMRKVVYAIVKSGYESRGEKMQYSAAELFSKFSITGGDIERLFSAVFDEKKSI